MSLNRYATRKDANHSDITDALKRACVPHWDIEWPSDLLAVHRDGRLIALEIKSHAKAKLRASQAEIQRVAPQAFVRVETALEALYAVGAV